MFEKMIHDFVFTILIVVLYISGIIAIILYPFTFGWSRRYWRKLWEPVWY
jgi:hypothetical protein